MLNYSKFPKSLALSKYTLEKLQRWFFLTSFENWGKNLKQSHQSIKFPPRYLTCGLWQSTAVQLTAPQQYFLSYKLMSTYYLFCPCQIRKHWHKSCHTSLPFNHHHPVPPTACQAITTTSARTLGNGRGGKVQIQTRFVIFWLTPVVNLDRLCQIFWE